MKIAPIVLDALIAEKEQEIEEARKGKGGRGSVHNLRYELMLLKEERGREEYQI